MRNCKKLSYTDKIKWRIRILWMLLKEQMRMEQDERNQYLHDKSGGIIVDILLLSLLFITVTAALFNMAAFYTAITILGLTVALKAAAYFFFSRR